MPPRWRGSAKVQVQLGAGSVYPKYVKSLFGARRSVQWPARAAKGQTVVSTGVKVEFTAKEAALKDAALQRDRADVDLIKEFGKAGKFFSAPLMPIAGATHTMFFNRAWGQFYDSKRRETVLIGGFNNWGTGDFRAQMRHVQTQGVDGDWWKCEFKVPENVYNMRLLFSDGGDRFDKSDDDRDYTLVPTFAPTKEECEAAIEEEIKRQAITRQAEEDMHEARDSVNQQRAGLEFHFKDAYVEWKHNDGSLVLWTEPAQMVPGTTATVFYNTNMTALNGQGDIVLMTGVNGWAAPEEIVMKRSTNGGRYEDNVFETKVTLAETTHVLDIVVTNGSKSVYDNNNRKDYHLKVASGALLTEAEWEAAAVALFKKRRTTRLMHQLNEERRQEELTEKRARTRMEATKVLRKKLMHVLYTEPANPVAGEKVTIFYNNKNTNLEWSEEIWLRASFNRWTHAAPLAPIKMGHVANCPHLCATIEVPKDAHMVDCVFSSAGGDEEWVQYDNAMGLDYHFMTTGATTKPPPLHVMHIAVEMAPIAKVGGLGDVVTSLARAIQDIGHKVEIVLPKFAFLNHSPILTQMTHETSFDWGGCTHHVSTQLVEGVRVYFIDSQNGMFNTGSVYTTGNVDGPKFDFFCKAALEFMLKSGRQPDIIHCHDWSTAMATKFYWSDYHHNGLHNPRCVFTIHNLEFGQAKIGEAMFASQVATTVSPSYAEEISGHPAVSTQLAKFHGVVNGIDPEIWGPEEDQFLPMQFSSDNCTAGKEASREELRRRLGLTGWEDRPIVAIISRLTAQKGIDLIKHAANHTKSRGAQFILLGSAPDPKIQSDFNALGSHLSDENAAFIFQYDEPLSHLIYAGADMICVPSIFEPCGLTQLIAMRYGTVPIVRQTGGLYDTVFDVDHDKGRAAWEIFGSVDPEKDGVDGTNGFSFGGADASSFNYALDRALDGFYNDRNWFRSLQQRCMTQDWSWNKPALTYIELYHQAKKQ